MRGSRSHAHAVTGDVLASDPTCVRVATAGVAETWGSSPVVGVMAAASVRPAASSLPRMFDTCTETVLALMNSCLPISPFERPSATSARISVSRG